MQKLLPSPAQTPEQAALVEALLAQRKEQDFIDQIKVVAMTNIWARLMLEGHDD